MENHERKNSESTPKGWKLSHLSDERAAQVLQELSEILATLYSQKSHDRSVWTRDPESIEFEREGPLTPAGEVMRRFLGRFHKFDFAAFKWAALERRLTLPSYYPTAIALADLIHDAVTLQEVAQGKKFETPSKPAQLPTETHMDSLRARTTGDKPAYSPMKAEWLRQEGESSKEHGDRMMDVAETIMPGLAALRRLREARRRAEQEGRQ